MNYMLIRTILSPFCYKLQNVKVSEKTILLGKDDGLTSPSDDLLIL